MSAPADLVRQGDPDRFRATLAAPPALREALFTLFAVNLELARIPWVTQEPLIAEMRLQWWRDLIEGQVHARDPLGTALTALLARQPALGPVLDRLIAARRAEAWRGVFDSDTALWAFLEETSGSLLWAQAIIAGAGLEWQDPVREMGAAAGLANFFLALPHFARRGYQPLARVDALGAASLARQGLRRYAAGRRGLRHAPAGLRRALLSVWMTGPILNAARRAGPDLPETGLALSEFRRRAGLLWALILARP